GGDGVGVGPVCGERRQGRADAASGASVAQSQSRPPARLSQHPGAGMPLTDEERAQVARLLDAQGDGRKFRDPDFPHAPASLAVELREDVRGWRRPRKIAEKPQLFVDGISHHDVQQGRLGDCWFLAAATALAQYPDLIRQVMPEDQPLCGSDYHGIIVARFWRMGQWVSVYIDDKLPIDEDNDLVYGKCTTSNEFWLPLLEKAFAKFHGNYENIVGGFSSEAFLSLTGFVREEDRKGLPGLHAYTVTGVGSLRLGDGLVRLVRVRNPHATGEWEGAWNDSDPNWNEIDGQKLDELGYKKQDDGQFWIKMSHFRKHFPEVWLAARLPDFGDDYETLARQSFVVSHCWDVGLNAGGSDCSDPKFLTNPQFTLIVPQRDEPERKSEEDDEESESEEEEIGDIVIQLIQEQDRSKYQDLNSIGILIFKLTRPESS
ncbi:Calpain-A, partial [Gryllus bimaculatus]